MGNRATIGFFSFTEVLDGRHREYNDWHLLDHMPEQFRLDGVHWGQRWVATPELIERRLYAAEGIAASQHMTLYLMSEPLQPVLADFYALAHTLRAADRWFDARRSHLSGPFALVKTHVVPRVLVDADVLPYRPNRGLFVTVQDHAGGATDAALDEARQWYEQVHIPDLLTVRGVTGCWEFEAIADAPTAPGAPPNPPGRTIRVYWLDDDPVQFHDDLRDKTPSFSMMDLRPAYTTVLVGAYRSVSVDTDFSAFDDGNP